MNASRLLLVVLLASTPFAAVAVCQRELQMTWMLPASRESAWPPASAVGKIYSVQAGTGVTVIEEASGSVVWSFDDADLVGGPALTGNTVIVCKIGHIVSFSINDGNAVAQFSLGAADEVPCHDGAPVVADGKIYFGTSAGKVYALDAATLSSVWTADLGATNGVSAPVSLWNRHVVAGTFSGSVFLIASDGSIARSYSTPNVPEFNPANGVIFGIQTGFAISGNIAYYGTNTDANHLIALDLVSMTSKWRVTLSSGAYSYTTPIVSNGILYTTSCDGRVFGVDAISGTINWSVTLERIEVRGPLSIIDDTIVVTTSAGSIAGVHMDANDIDFWFALGFAGMPHSSVVSTDALRIVYSGDQMIFPLGLGCHAGSR